MKIARIQRPGRSAELVDVSDDDASGVLLEPRHSAPEGGSSLDDLLQHGDILRSLRRTTRTIDLSAPGLRWLPPVMRPSLILCPGQNFDQHATESAFVETPTRPSAFLRVPRTLNGHLQSLPYPRGQTNALDYEVEVAAVLGPATAAQTSANGVSIAGLCLANDVSARDIQTEEARAGSILLSKNLPGTLPLGPWLTTPDELPDLAQIEISLTVNGEERQRDQLSSMIVPFDELLLYWSPLGLRPGDVVLSGTPAGVGIFREPAERYLLKPGDRVACHSPQLGNLEINIDEPTADTGGRP
jgi:acylpyruvate hydrolase